MYENKKNIIMSFDILRIFEVAKWKVFNTQNVQMQIIDGVKRRCENCGGSERPAKAVCVGL